MIKIKLKVYIIVYYDLYNNLTDKWIVKIFIFT